MPGSPEPTHVAFSNESQFNTGRFRAIALVSCPVTIQDPVYARVSTALQDSHVREFKWQNLRQATERFAAQTIIDIVLLYGLQKLLRVDILTWDTQDVRHAISRRDDVANLQRIHCHLFKKVLINRRPGDSIWVLHPDEHTAMDWESVVDYLEISSVSVRSVEPDLLSRSAPLRLILEEEFRIHNVQEIRSHENPICQIADLFAGIGPYSFIKFERYRTWLPISTARLSFSFVNPIHVTHSELERFKIMQYLETICKALQLGVGIKTSRGFRAYDPSIPINFWLYKPQHPADRAPTKPPEASA